MRRNQIKGIAGLITALCLTANIWMFPACAEEAQTETPEEATEQMHQWKSGSELEDGILTIRIEAEGNTDPDFWWQNSTADKGDASFVEPAGQKEEEGLAFCGSYRAIEEDWEGEDTIRLVYTNGHYTAEYMEWTVSIKNGDITEVTGGGQAFAASGEDLAPVLGGIWQEENGPKRMEIALGENDSLEFTILDEKANDGNGVSYTMHAYYDAEKDALVYWDVVADPADDRNEGDMEGGSGVFGIIPASEDSEDLQIFWQDNTFENYDTGRFLKAE